MNLAIDLSHYQQGKIKWDKILSPVQIDAYKVMKVSSVFIKTSEGNTFKDGSCKEHSINAKLKGLQIGYYHFCRAGGKDIQADAESEADNFNSQLENLIEADYPATLDLETNDILTPEEFQYWIKAFIARLKRPIMIYGGYSFLNDNLPHNHNLSHYPLWLAQYHNTNIQPHLPNGWNTWRLWQFTEKLQHPAIDGFVDASLVKEIISL